ncbi:DNA methyltransferase [Streptomyces sp. NPDC006999]|uniref:Eco57I restriction-modification methylase domain-containing protein n=1 Tax=Streptomyces sp. NPDC006999 TaxID=3156909 RepID=UPI0033C67E83
MLLDSTLDPVIDEAQRRGERAAAEAGRSDARDNIVSELLSLTVCDPACGSGHFLVAAARRIAKRVAAVREHTPEPTPESVRHALHEVIARCVYGVDLNPMAVELAKVSLWMEALEPGKALGFLDAHVKLGNGLIGATPALLRGGIPEQAFKVVEGDDKSVASDWLKRNKLEHEGVYMLDAALDEQVRVTNDKFASELRHVVERDNDPTAKLGRVRAFAERYRTWQESPTYVNALHITDAWCAAFMWEKTGDAPAPVTQRVFLSLQNSEGEGALQETHQEIVRLSREYQFFHWHLEFPDVFGVPDDSLAAVAVDPVTGWAGGFDCVLGNPPWEKVDFKDQEYFSIVKPSLARISGTARREAIKIWSSENPEQADLYHTARRRVKSSFLFFGQSGAFPFVGRGLTVKGVNFLQTDQLFAERFVSITAPHGRIGAVVPTQIATGASAQFLFQDLTNRSAVKHLYDFENGKRERIFPAVHASYQFALISLTGPGISEAAARFAFFLGHPDEITDREAVFRLTPEEISLINPNSGTLPVFRTRRDADLMVDIHRKSPVLRNRTRSSENAWNVEFKRLFDMTDDFSLFHNRETLEAQGWKLKGNTFVRDDQRMLALHEGRMGHQFTHRFADSVSSTEPSQADLDNPDFLTLPEYWVAEPVVQERLESRKMPPTSALLGHRRVARATDERTSIAAIIPWGAASYGWIISEGPKINHLPALAAMYNSFVFDYALRNSLTQPSVPQGVSEQLPAPQPTVVALFSSFITSRVLELTYTACDMKGFACDLADEGSPFRHGSCKS